MAPCDPVAEVPVADDVEVAPEVPPPPPPVPPCPTLPCAVPLVAADAVVARLGRGWMVTANGMEPIAEVRAS